ncbi:unnamed protein product [Paramecium primaurelia]|uniref:Uncharacterized protein n=1 Tax=Paramecium primaurelia TaxID=5886 RepID=A0A8S1NET2_PARPR|nr:unnamed protein product [Paramecium primaurelia]
MEEQRKENNQMLWEKLTQQRENKEYLEQVQLQREQNIRNQTKIERFEKDLQDQKEKAENQRKQMEERMKCFRKKPIRRKR